MSAKGTPWFKLHSQLRDHPKVADLADELDIPRALAIGHLVMLWCWVNDYYPDGCLGPMKPRRIERAADWHGEPGALVAACEAVRLIDRDVSGNITIRNWAEYAEGYKRSVAKRKSRKNTDTVRMSLDSVATVAGQSHDCRGVEERRGDREETETEKRGELTSLPSDTLLSFSDVEHLLSREQLGMPAVLRRVGGGVSGMGDLATPRTSYPVSAGELRYAVAKATGAKGPNYIAAVIAGRRRERPSARNGGCDLDALSQEIAATMTPIGVGNA